MKLRASICPARIRAGSLLIESLVYISVFAVILGLGIGAFYVCWDHSKALHYAVDDITAALRAGERWRADVRLATGAITGNTTADGGRVCIPHGTNKIIYRFSSGEIRRQVATSDFSELLLAKVKASEMVKETRGPVTAWRWELELYPHRKETRLPLAFTFEAAAQMTP
jgi:hypothetical protein